MFVFMDHNRRFFEQARAHAVSTLIAFCPYCALQQARFRCRVSEGWIAKIIQHHAIAVRQHDGVSRSSQLLIKIRHLFFCNCQHIGDAFLALFEFSTADNERIITVIRIQTIFIEAPNPGASNRAFDRGFIRRQCALHN